MLADWPRGGPSCRAASSSGAGASTRTASRGGGLARCCRGTHGSWAYRVDLGPGIDRDGVFRGRRQRYRSGFATKAAAAAALAELSASVSQGSHVEASRLTVGVYLQQWLEGRTRLRPTTRESYERYLERYFVPLLGHIELGQLRAVDIERAYAEIRKGSGRGVKRKDTIEPATLLRLHSVLKAALNTAVRRKLLPYNPALAVELEQVRRPRVRPFEREELGRFLDEAGKHHLGPLFEVMALTGLRRGEAVGLRWQDVDLSRGILVVRQQIVRQRDQLVAGPPKTRTGEDRRVDLDSGTPRSRSPRTSTATCWRASAATPRSVRQRSCHGIPAWTGERRAQVVHKSHRRQRQRH